MNKYLLIQESTKVNLGELWGADVVLSKCVFFYVRMIISRALMLQTLKEMAKPSSRPSMSVEK